MRASRWGLVLAIAYLTLSLVSIAFGYAADNVEARVVLLQLPLLPALVALGAAGLLPSVSDVPWAVAYAVVLPLVALGLYGLARAVGLLAWRTRLAIGTVVLLLASVALFWPRRQ